MNKPVIPARENYTKDHYVVWHIYKERHWTENFFSKIKYFIEGFALDLTKLAPLSLAL